MANAAAADKERVMPMIYYEAFIDIDTLIDEYSIEWCVYLSQKVEGRYGAHELWIRRSASGNTHLKLAFTSPLSSVDVLCIRAIMRDDAYRIRGDLERLALGADYFNLIFGTKIDMETGVITDAGEWHRLK